MGRIIKGLIVCAGLLVLTAPAAPVLAAGVPGPDGPHTDIIGGQPASENYQFIASMQPRGGGHFCGGALIRPNWVLTAGHCMEGETPGGVQMRIGSNDYRTGGTVAFTDRWTDHPAADISVVHLTSS